MAGPARTLLVLVTIVSVAFAGCSARGESVTVEAPDWQAGFTWSHNGTVRYAFEEVFEDEQENGTGDSEFTLTERVVNTGFDADGEPVHLTVQHLTSTGDDVGLPSVPWLGAYRQRDLKPLEVDGERRDSCRNDGPCSTTLQGVDVEDEQPENEWLPFPIRTGDTWGGSYDIFGGAIGMAYTMEAGRMRTIQTPLGPVEALRIDVHHRPTNLTEAMREIREEAQEDGYVVEDLRIDIRVDGVLYYSPAYQTMVQTIHTREEFFSATFPDGEGGKATARSEHRYEERSSLVGARLVAGPELDLGEITALLKPGSELGDVAGVPVPAADYRIVVDAKDPEVNAFASESGLYQARVEGRPELPEGHTLHWSLQSGGKTLQNATGTAFEPTPKSPGRYAVVLEARAPDGSVVASAGSGLVAHYEGAWEVPCSVVTSSNFGLSIGECEPQSLPVHPGAKSIRLVATPSGSDNPTGRLEVEDAIGRPVPVRSEGNARILDVQDFDGLNVDDVPWTAAWELGLGVLESAHFDVLIDYGTAPKGTVMVAETEAVPGGGVRGMEAGTFWPEWLPASG